MESKNNTSKYNEKNFVSKRKIGSGAFGNVYLLKLAGTGEEVAMKTVFQDKRYKNRELSVMKVLDHPNIVKLLNYYYTTELKNGKNEQFLNCVMDYVPETLSSLISDNRKNRKIFPLPIIKVFAFQMLKSIGYLHAMGICHRDIKPQNVLVGHDYTLKLCDFGCAKKLVEGEPNIEYICSRYYRPPELVLGNRFYSTKVDVWSMGCVITELVLNKPIFPGSSSKDQLFEIMSILGSPSKEQLTAMNVNPAIKIPHKDKTEWRDVFRNKINDENYIDLVSKLLTYEPDKRLSPYEAMCHPFFDDIKKGFTLPDGKDLPKHFFEFKQCEINFDSEHINALMKRA